MTSTCYLTFLEAASCQFKHGAVYMYQRNVRERTHNCTRLLLRRARQISLRSLLIIRNLALIFSFSPHNKSERLMSFFFSKQIFKDKQLLKTNMSSLTVTNIIQKKYTNFIFSKILQDFSQVNHLNIRKQKEQ